MKTSRFSKLLAVILSLTLAFSVFAVPAGASHAYPIIGNDSENAIGVVFADILETLIKFIEDIFSGLFNDNEFIPEDSFATDVDPSKNYYTGTGSFYTDAEAGARWHVGYAYKSLIPNDFSSGEYFIGGFMGLENGMNNVVEDVIDDMRVRCVALNDGSGNGTVLFATIDCIGITNADIKLIREAAIESLANEGIDTSDIKAINVSSTHAHSCIDTEGLWTKMLYKLLYNGVNNATGTDEEMLQGTNPEYMKFLTKQCAKALVNAYKDMDNNSGTLTYTLIDAGQEYFKNKNRPSAGQIIYEQTTDKRGNPITVDSGKTKIAMTDINRFIFTPDDEEDRPIMMVNMAAHPDIVGLPTSSNSGREVSGDYVYYIDEFLTNYSVPGAQTKNQGSDGYDFMFFQGAQLGIYADRGVTGDGVSETQRVNTDSITDYYTGSGAAIPSDHRVYSAVRYGYEIARICLSMELSVEEIEAIPALSCEAEYEANKDNIDETTGKPNYSFFYKDWVQNEETGEWSLVDAWEAVESVEVKPYLNLIISQVEVDVDNSLIQAVGKLDMANYVVKAKNDGTYSTIVEIGYIEIGQAYKAVMLPGEVCQDLIAKDGASLLAKYSATAQDFTSLPACNIFGEDVKCMGLMNDAIGYIVPDNDYTLGDPANHYHELISIGSTVASSLMNGLAEMAGSITYR